MKIEFADSQLARICTDEAHKLGLPIAVISAARKKLFALEQAPDERTLRNFKSFNYKKLQGTKDGRRSIRVNDQYRIIFTLDNSTVPPTVRVLDIGDTH
ncbi:MAG: hypothetical protein F4051_12285 [Boseongicola sp. SB0670_bin_30]|nr:hypothetical protein [Boseongicola sp. SB0670_bin_30]